MEETIRGDTVCTYNHKLYLKLFKNQNFGKVPQSSSLRSLSLVYFHGYDYRSFFVVPCHPAAK